MSKDNPRPETPGGVGEPAANVGAAGPPPSGSEALWLIITVVNLTLLLWLIPEEKLQFSETRVGLWVKIVPVVIAVLGAGYVWIKVQFAQFVRHTSYKILQTALLAALLTIHISQLPIFPIYPKLDPADALVSVDGAPPHQLKRQRLFTTVGDHTATVSSADGEDKREFEVSYKDVLFGLFYQPNWSLHNKVMVSTVQPNVRITIQKVCDPAEQKPCEPFEPDFRAKPPNTLLKPQATSLTSVAGDERMMQYIGVRQEGIYDDEIRLPTGKYKLIFRRDNCAQTFEQTLTVQPGETPRISVEQLCADEQS